MSASFSSSLCNNIIDKIHYYYYLVIVTVFIIRHHCNYIIINCRILIMLRGPAALGLEALRFWILLNQSEPYFFEAF